MRAKPKVPKEVKEAGAVHRGITAKLLKEVRGKFGEQSAVVFSQGGYSSVKSVLPTRHPVLDRYVIGVGGVPYGHVTEIWGKEGGGKSTLLLGLAAQCQAEKGFVFIRDAEHKLQHGWAVKHGLDLDGVFLQAEGSVEDFIDMSMYLMEKVPKGPFLIGLDSVAFLPTKEEIGKDGEAAIGANARGWAEKLKVFIPAIAKREAAFVFVNQPRNMITNFGAFPTTPGGNALKAAPLLRLKVKPGEKYIDPTRGEGILVEVTANKNQLAPPFRTCKLRLNFNGTWDTPWSILDHAKDMGCIDKKASRTQWKEAAENLGWADCIPVVEAQLDREKNLENAIDVEATPVVPAAEE